MYKDLNQLQISPESLTKRDMFGGAIALSIPTQWRDVSDVRQVPDHQEVYQDCTFKAEEEAQVANFEAEGKEQATLFKKEEGIQADRLIVEEEEQVALFKAEEEAQAVRCLESEKAQSARSKVEEEVQECKFAGADVGKFTLQGTGGCLIVEILGREEQVGDEDAAMFFFRDLAEANGDLVGDLEYNHVWTVGRNPRESNGKDDESKEQVEDSNLMPNLPVRVKACSCIGLQSVDPLRNRIELGEGKASRIRVELCALRLEDVDTDLLITLTMPHAEESGNATGEEGHSSLFLDILESFEIVDWSLFG